MKPISNLNKLVKRNFRLLGKSKTWSWCKMSWSTVLISRSRRFSLTSSKSRRLNLSLELFRELIRSVEKRRWLGIKAFLSTISSARLTTSCLVLTSQPNRNCSLSLWTSLRLPRRFLTLTRRSRVVWSTSFHWRRSTLCIKTGRRLHPTASQCLTSSVLQPMLMADFRAWWIASSEKSF